MATKREAGQRRREQCRVRGAADNEGEPTRNGGEGLRENRFRPIHSARAGAGGRGRATAGEGVVSAAGRTQSSLGFMAECAMAALRSHSSVAQRLAVPAD